MPHKAIDRASSRLSSTGNSFHLIIAKPLVGVLHWPLGVELELQVLDDGSLRVLTRDQYWEELLAERKLQWQREHAGAQA